MTFAQFKDLIPLLTSIFGVMGTIGAVWVTQHYNNQRSDRESAKVESRENKKLLLSKGEEAYHLFTEFRTLVLNVQTYQAAIADDQLTDEDYQKYSSEQDAGKAHNRLQTLIKIYFPDGANLWDSLLTNIDDCTRVYVNDRPFTENSKEKIKIHRSNTEMALAFMDEFIRHEIKDLIAPSENQK